MVQLLIDENVSQLNDFAWISQLRYYMAEQNMVVKMINTKFNYGYEYLGNSGRLVIIPC